MQEKQEYVNPAVRLYATIKALAPEADHFAVDVSAQTFCGEPMPNVTLRAYIGDYGVDSVDVARGYAGTEEEALTEFKAKLAEYRSTVKVEPLPEPLSDLRAEDVGGEQGETEAERDHRLDREMADKDILGGFF